MQLNISGIVGFGIALLTATVSLAGPLPTDPAALAAWRGSQVISSTKLTGTVQYAVYAPGQFQTSAALGNPVDPTGGADYIYAYEIIAGSQLIKDLTVGIQTGAVPAASPFVGHFAGTPELGVGPTTSIFNSAGPSASNAKWTDLGPTFWMNNHSDILYFASAFPPHLFVSSLSQGGAVIATNFLPSPIPEPGTAALSIVAVACMAVVARRLRKR